MLMHKAPPNAALIGAFTLRFHLNARRGRVVPRRTDVRDDLKPGYPTLHVSSRLCSRADKEGDAGATRRASATRSHEPSRGIKRVLDFSLSRQTNGSHESLLRGPTAPSSTSTSTTTFATTFSAAHVPSSLPLFHSGGSFLRGPSRALTKRFVPTDVRSHTWASERSHAYESSKYFDV